MYNSTKHKVWELTKFKHLLLDITQKMIFVFDKIVNNVGKGENAGYHHFLLFPQCFQKASSLGLLTPGIVL